MFKSFYHGLRNDTRKNVKSLIGILAKYYISRNNIYIVGFFGDNDEFLAKNSVALENALKHSNINVVNSIFPFKNDLELPYILVNTVVNDNSFDRFLGLIKFIFKTILMPPGEKVVVLNLRTNVPSIIKYWSFLQLDILVIDKNFTNTMDRFLISYVKKNGKIITNILNKSIKNSIRDDDRIWYYIPHEADIFFDNIPEEDLEKYNTISTDKSLKHVFISPRKTNKSHVRKIKAGIKYIEFLPTIYILNLLNIQIDDIGNVYTKRDVITTLKKYYDN